MSIISVNAYANDIQKCEIVWYRQQPKYNNNIFEVNTNITLTLSAPFRTFSTFKTHLKSRVQHIIPFSLTASLTIFCIIDYFFCTEPLKPLVLHTLNE